MAGIELVTLAVLTAIALGFSSLVMASLQVITLDGNGHDTIIFNLFTLLVAAILALGLGALVMRLEIISHNPFELY